MINISIVNQSTVFKDADLPALANALQIHAKRDLFPAWGVPVQVFYTPSGSHATADHWAIYLLDDADAAGELGVHDLTPAALPLGKSFVKTTLADGGLPSVTTAHEFDEMLLDPWLNLLAKSGSKIYAYELDDAVESDADGYDVDVPADWKGGPSKVRMSNFCLPAWFEEGNKKGPYDFLGQLKAPFTLRPGGYANVLDLANLGAGWTQIFGDNTPVKARIAARPRPGSRRSRRMLPRSEWQLSTYKPSNPELAANPAQSYDKV